VWTTRIPAAGDHSRLDAFAASAGNALDVEHGDRHSHIVASMPSIESRCLHTMLKEREKNDETRAELIT